MPDAKWQREAIWAFCRPAVGESMAAKRVLRSARAKDHALFCSHREGASEAVPAGIRRPSARGSYEAQSQGRRRDRSQAPLVVGFLIGSGATPFCCGLSIARAP